MGVEFTRAEVEARAAATNDTEGHGTHVSAIAASTGNENGKYRGVAPGAWLIVVKAGGKLGIAPTVWSFNDTDIIDGISYVMERASSLGMRAVINLSLGSNIGGHDGTSPLELALEEAARRGATIVVAAGNSADSNIHAEGNLVQGRTTELRWFVPDKVVVFDVGFWHDPRDSVEVVLRLPSGETVPFPTGDQGLETPAGIVTTYLEQSDKGRGYVFEVLAPGSSVSRGTYSLLITPIRALSGTPWDAWLDDIPLDSRSSEFLSGSGYSLTSAETVSIPGTSDYVITVGAYTGRRSAPDYRLGDLCGFSGRGPTRDGRTKPDVVAPGLFVVAAWSSTATGLRDHRIDDAHVYLSGTSMATPHVTGVVALMLQWDPSLSPDSLKQVLRQSARLDSITGKVNKLAGDFNWGWGKLDARRAVSMVRVDITVTGIPYYVRLTIGVDGRDRTTVVGPASLTLYVSGGTSHTVSVPNAVGQGAVRYFTPVSEYSVSSDSVVAFSFELEYYVDVETEYGNASGSGWYRPGSTVDPRVEPTQVQIGEGIRAVFKGWNVSTPLVVTGPTSIRANWSEQCLLTIRSTVGDPEGGGWYDKGTKAVISIKASVPVEGVLGLLGARYVLEELRTENGTLVSPDDIIMNSPMTLVPTYRLDYSVTLMYVVVLVFAAGTGAVVVRRLLRRSDVVSVPPPPPP
jgi:subtilisin family serine protease